MTLGGEPQPRSAATPWVVLAALAAADLAVLKSLSIETGPVVIMLGLAAGVAGGFIALGQPSTSSRLRRALIYAGIVLGVIVPSVVGVLIRPPEDESRKDDPLSVQHALKYMPECGTNPCEAVKTITTGTGTGQVVVFGIQRSEKKYTFAAVESAVLILNPDGSLRWKSSFSPGYGLTEMDTDVTGHIFVEFAVTNHAGVAWVLDIRPGEVEDFGTRAGHLAVDGYSNPDRFGVRYLYTYRHGWYGAGSGLKTTLRDYFVWDGSAYRFAGCQEVSTAKWEPIRDFPPGSVQCPAPVGRHSVDLPPG
jgi:hypothetical protein